MDKSTACQHALSLLGEMNFAKHTAPKSACDMAYSDVVRFANNAAHWSFARSRRTLSPMAPPANNNIRAFMLPADCLKIIQVVDTATGRKVPHWTLYAGRIEVKDFVSDTIDLIYTSDMLAAQSELPDQAPDFCQYVIHLLAARIAPAVTGQLDLATLMEQKASFHLAQAIYADARQYSSNDQAPRTSATGYPHNPAYFSD